MTIHRWGERGYRLIRDAVWASPIARSPAAAHAAIRVGYWARKWLRLAPQREEVAMASGHNMWFGPGSECYLDMTQGTWEPGVIRCLETTLKPGMVVVDVGAHIGYFSLLAARKVGSTGRVYAFEPAPLNYSLLIRNITLNGYQNIVPVQKAISNHEGTATFFLHPDSVAHSLLAETCGRATKAIEVETITLDRFLTAEGWPPVHLAKLDIEGAEPAALEGMRGLLARNRTIRLIVEYIPHILQRAGHRPRRFLDTLRGLGFRVQMITDDGGLVDLSDKLLDDPELRTELWCERNGT